MPFNFAVQPRHTVVLLIRNHTRDMHTFAIPAIGLNVAVPAAHTVRVTFVASHYGVYRWYCVPRVAPGTIRTCDLCLRRAALYPLSYGRSERAV